MAEKCADPGDAPPAFLVRVRANMPRSLLVEHAAALLGVSRRTIYYRIRDGKLRTVRTPGGSQRVLMESIELLKAQQPTDRGAAVSGTDPSAKFPAP
jgi:excisionase family DNA binding protein